MEQPGENGAASGAVGFPIKEFRRVPAIVEGQKALDELPDRTGVLIDSPKVLVLAGGDGRRITGADGIDEYQIAFVEEAVGIGFQRVRSRRERRQTALDAYRGERPQHHEDRRR